MHHRFNETISVNDDLIVLRVTLTNRIEENAQYDNKLILRYVWTKLTYRSFQKDVRKQW